MVDVIVLRLCSAGRSTGSPVWHLCCVTVHLFGYMPSTHTHNCAGQSVSRDTGGGSACSERACGGVHDTLVAWCALHVCMPVSNRAVPCALLPVSRQLSSVWECRGSGCPGAVLPGRGQWLWGSVECPYVLVVLCVSGRRDLLAARWPRRRWAGAGPDPPSLEQLSPPGRKRNLRDKDLGPGPPAGARVTEGRVGTAPSPPQS